MGTTDRFIIALSLTFDSMKSSPAYSTNFYCTTQSWYQVQAMETFHSSPFWLVRSHLIYTKGKQESQLADNFVAESFVFNLLICSCWTNYSWTIHVKTNDHETRFNLQIWIIENTFANMYFSLEKQNITKSRKDYGRE